jgi:hypothetical protein
MSDNSAIALISVAIGFAVGVLGTCGIFAFYKYGPDVSEKYQKELTESQHRSLDLLLENFQLRHKLAGVTGDPYGLREVSDNGRRLVSFLDSIAPEDYLRFQEVVNAYIKIRLGC